MSTRRTACYLVLALSLLSLAFGPSGADAWTGLDQTGFRLVPPAPEPREDASTGSRGPVLEHAATPQSDHGRLAFAHSVGVTAEPPNGPPASSQVLPRELALACGRAPLYLRNCSFLC